MKLNLIRQRNSWWFLSNTIILSTIISLLISYQQIDVPLYLGSDFVSGTRLQFERDCSKPGNCDKPINLNVIREIAKAQGLGNNSIQIVVDKETGREIGVTIKTKNLESEQRIELQNILSENIGTFDPQKNQIDTVGPTLGREMFTSTLTALIVSLTGIILYLSFRFYLDYAIFAIITLLHNVSIAAGIFSILGLVLDTEIDTLFIVALLMIIVFSVKNTVVIYARIRETLQTNHDLLLVNIVNHAINQTFSYLLNTTLIMLLLLFGILLIGGETLKNFALILVIGFTVGIYSNIFIIGFLLVFYKKSIDRDIPSGPIAKKANPLLVFYKENIDRDSPSGPIAKKANPLLVFYKENIDRDSPSGPIAKKN